VTDRLDVMRREYVSAGLDEADLAETWLAQFQRWLADAVGGGMPEPNAMTFATADAGGRPSARTVLLKGVDERGFLLFTNLRSRKGREALENPRGTLVFPWLELQRQVIVEGAVEVAGDEESDAYFATRPRGAQLGAVASPQSQVITSRAELERFRADAEAKHPETVSRPTHWGGLRVVPEAVEFWQGRPDRLHDRLRFRRATDGQWGIERLAP
jgi:pyridoxamine 5'-phosphate oxidase